MPAAPAPAKGVQEGSSNYALSRNKALLRCAYSLPVTPQMLLLATQRLNDGKGADTDSIVSYVQAKFPVGLNGGNGLEEEIRRKLAICVNAGVLDVEPKPSAEALTHTCSWFNSAKECEACKVVRFKPPRDIALGRLQSSHLKRFYAHVVQESQRGLEGSLPQRKTVGLWWHQRLTRRIIDSARNLAARVADSLDAEDDHATQTDNMLTDWVSPDVADADYIM